MNITCLEIPILINYVYYTSNSLRLVTTVIIIVQHTLVAFQHAFPYKNINEGVMVGFEGVIVGFV